MSINAAQYEVTGFDKELLMNVEGYLAKPVTVSKDTIQDLKADADGHYVIPQGTYLVGASGSLFDDPMQLAIQATTAETQATVTVNSSVVITAKKSGALAYTIKFVAGTSATPNVTFASNTLTVKLGVNKSGTIKTTYDEVVKLINSDMTANTYVVAKLAEGVDGSTVAAATASDAVTAGGADETAGAVDGILYHSVCVDDGEQPATMVFAGYVNVDALPVEPTNAIKSALPHIKFGRID